MAGEDNFDEPLGGSTYNQIYAVCVATHVRYGILQAEEISQSLLKLFDIAARTTCNGAPFWSF
jgi:hypothetical protein